MTSALGIVIIATSANGDGRLCLGLKMRNLTPMYCLFTVLGNVWETYDYDLSTMAYDQIQRFSLKVSDKPIWMLQELAIRV
jgi:hypothetical protein